MRLTNSTLEVAVAMLAKPPGTKLWGYELSKDSGVRSGVMYPILRRMLDQGWLSDGWEEPTEMTEGRPPRRYYELTDHGRRELTLLVARAAHDARFRGLRPRLLGGTP